MRKLMLEFPAFADGEDKRMSSFDIMEVMCIHQVLENNAVLDDRCVVEFKNGKSMTVAVGYDELKERFNNSGSNEATKFPLRPMGTAMESFFHMDDFKDAVKADKTNKTDDFKEMAKLWMNGKKRKN